ncbi:competence protein ComGC [Salirhabdus euzebyi]|uniref:Competence protein ComGC n=1 Tax=Salirhabdus euzebyi TaxID=394506 RepID=A0A841Q9Z5_9BACI|nr:prepilin-type N-terminal cleavage/methylation domain-containing protein [Salirhabdus euzebyi]MBB6455052.1 competence protein ComGC [Salirhabdus euzebyi]
MKILSYFRNQKGITLAELLGTIVLISIVSALLMGIIISSMKNYESVESSNHIRNQANQIMFQLTTIHQNNLEYTLQYIDQHAFEIEYVATNGEKKSLLVERESYQYELEVDGLVLSPTQEIFIDLTNQDQLSVTVELSLQSIGSARNDDVTVQSTISRMTTAREGD